jgi:hypothetical protein
MPQVVGLLADRSVGRPTAMDDARSSPLGATKGHRYRALCRNGMVRVSEAEAIVSGAIPEGPLVVSMRNRDNLNLVAVDDAARPTSPKFVPRDVVPVEQVEVVAGDADQLDGTYAKPRPRARVDIPVVTIRNHCRRVGVLGIHVRVPHGHPIDLALRQTSRLAQAICKGEHAREGASAVRGSTLRTNMLGHPVKLAHRRRQGRGTLPGTAPGARTGRSWVRTRLTRVYSSPR